MNLLKGILKANRSKHGNSKDVEERFLRLYSTWHKTHDLSLRKKLYLRLEILMRRFPHFDLRSRFDSAF